MRVTIEHREEAAGLSGNKRNYFVDCSIEFSEEEKAIIEARALHDSIVTSGFTAAPVGLVKGESPYWLRGVAPLMIFGGFIFGVLGGGSLAGLFVFGGIGFLIYGYIAPRLHEKQSSERFISVRDVLRDRSFSLYAAMPASAKQLDENLREQLVALKSMIAGSAEIAEKQTFEL